MWSSCHRILSKLKKKKYHTGSKNLCEDALLVGAVDVVRSLSCFVRSVKQATIFRVPEQKLSQLSASASDCDVERRVSFLSKK